MTRWNVILGAMLAVAAALGVGGCESAPLGPGQIPPPRSPDPRWAAPLPAYPAVAAAYNARLAGLDRFRAAVTVVIDGPDGQGGRRHDQLEGNLQLVPPLMVALRLDKVGQTVFHLGSNQKSYWWLDLTDSKVGIVGAHANSSQRSAEQFGIPVYPPDLLDLLAVTPLPSSAAGVSMAWESSRSALRVNLPPKGTGRGRTSLVLDPATFRPRVVEVYGGDGQLVASSTCGQFQAVETPSGSKARPMVAERYDVRVPSVDARATLSIYEPRNPGEQMRMKSFELDTLLSAYGVTRIIDADAGDAR